MSFRTKIILNINILIFILMMSLAAILIHLREREITNSMKKDAMTFATLTAGPLCEAYDNYYISGYYKFRELVLSLLSLDKELERVMIYTVDGEKVFDSDVLKGKGVNEIEKERKESIKERIRQVNPSFSSINERKYYDMIFPYLEPWGWHRYSVQYLFTKQYLKHRLSVLRIVIFTVTLSSILFASLIAHFLTKAITMPLDKLTDAAKEITAGNFDTKIEVKRKDEIGILARTLKEMVDRVKKDMDTLKFQKKVLSKANAELKRLNNLKSQFLASVTHELITPLTSVKGYIEYIYSEKMGPVTLAQKKGLEVAKRNIKRLSDQIMNLLDFSSFESRKIELSLSPFHIESIVKEVVTNIEAKFTGKGITFEENLPSNIPPVIADRERIIQVLENLLTNAIKYTPSSGKITIDCHKLDGARRGKIEVCVKDSGIGIPKTMKKKIFEKFFHYAPKGDYKGIGLGLSIVKSILDAHNERITVDSKEGKGSNFCFTLPVYEGSNK